MGSTKPAGGDRRPTRAHEPREEALRALLDDRGPRSWRGLDPYAKWQGVFWRLTTAVDLGPDASDARIVDMVDAVLDWLTSDRRRARLARSTVSGRVRWCATQDGLGLWAAAWMGRAGDPRARLLADSLVSWQWPDGGWNCDKRPEAGHSSFHETHGPLRGLSAYHRETGDLRAGRAAERAAGFLLAHRLYRSCRTGQVVHPELAKLHWPPYWHYDLLVGLRAVGSVGLLRRPQAADALGVLESARDARGGWRTNGRRHWRSPGSGGSNLESADLSEVAHAVVSAQAAWCLRQAGRGAGIPRQPTHDRQSPGRRTAP